MDCMLLDSLNPNANTARLQEILQVGPGQKRDAGLRFRAPSTMKPKE